MASISCAITGSTLQVSNIAALGKSSALDWTAAIVQVDGYNVYQGTTSGQENTRLNQVLITGTHFIIPLLPAGTSYYVIKSSIQGVESLPSNEVSRNSLSAVIQGSGKLKANPSLADKIAGRAFITGNLKANGVLADAISGHSVVKADVTLFSHITGHSSVTAHENAVGVLAIHISGHATVSAKRTISAIIVGHSLLKAQKTVKTVITGHSALISVISGLTSLIDNIVGQSLLKATSSISARLQGFAIVVPAIIGKAGIADVITGHSALSANPRLHATIAGHSSVSANLTAKGVLADAITGHSAITAKTVGQRAASITGSSSVSANLVGNSSLTDHITGRSVLTAVGTRYNVQDVIRGRSLVAVSARATGKLIDAIAGRALLTASLTGSVKAAITGHSSVSPNLTAKGVISENAIGFSFMKANGTDLNSRHDNITGTSVISASISGPASLFNFIKGQSLVKGLLNNSTIPTGVLVAAITGKATVKAQHGSQASCVGFANLTVSGQLKISLMANIQGQSTMTAPGTLTCSILGTSVFQPLTISTGTLMANIVGASLMQADIGAAQNFIQANATIFPTQDHNVSLPYLQPVILTDMLTCGLAYSYLAGSPAPVITVGDTQNNSWQLAGFNSVQYGPLVLVSALYWSRAGASESNTVQVNMNQYNLTMWMAIAEFSSATEPATIAGVGQNSPLGDSSSTISITKSPAHTPTDSLNVCLATSTAGTTSWSVGTGFDYHQIAIQSNGLVMTYQLNAYKAAPYCDMSPATVTINRANDASPQWAMVLQPFSGITSGPAILLH